MSENDATAVVSVLAAIVMFMIYVAIRCSTKDQPDAGKIYSALTVVLLVIAAGAKLGVLGLS